MKAIESDPRRLKGKVFVVEIGQDNSRLVEIGQDELELDGLPRATDLE